MKTTYELNEVVYLPHRIKIMETDENGDISYWCEPLFKSSDYCCEMPVVKECDLTEIKVFSEPYKPEDFRKES